jgi:hypothetical protein
MLAPALQIASDTAKIALAPSWIRGVKNHDGKTQRENYNYFFNNGTNRHVTSKYLLLAPSPFILSSIKLLNHEVINLSLSRRVL